MSARLPARPVLKVVLGLLLLLAAAVPAHAVDQVLQLETEAAGLDATALSAMLANLQEVAGLWRRLIAAPPGEARDGGTDFSHFGHIRG